MMLTKIEITKENVQEIAAKIKEDPYCPEAAVFFNLVGTGSDCNLPLRRYMLNVRMRNYAYTQMEEEDFLQEAAMRIFEKMPDWDSDNYPFFTFVSNLFRLRAFSPRVLKNVGGAYTRKVDGKAKIKLENVLSLDETVTRRNNGKGEEESFSLMDVIPSEEKGYDDAEFRMALDDIIEKCGFSDINRDIFLFIVENGGSNKIPVSALTDYINQRYMFPHGLKAITKRAVYDKIFNIKAKVRSVMKSIA